jgi:hypothetical protein
VDQVLRLLSTNQHFLKCSKCVFGAFEAFEVEYLIHIVRKDSVHVDPKNNIIYGVCANPFYNNKNNDKVQN